jgi:hypothetical protein
LGSALELKWDLWKRQLGSALGLKWDLWKRQLGSALELKWDLWKRQLGSALELKWDLWRNYKRLKEVQPVQRLLLSVSWVNPILEEMVTKGHLCNSLEQPNSTIIVPKAKW